MKRLRVCVLLVSTNGHVIPAWFVGFVGIALDMDPIVAMKANKGEILESKFGKYMLWVECNVLDYRLKYAHVHVGTQNQLKLGTESKIE